MWAKVEGYRWWPAVVLDPADHRDEMRDAPKMPRRSKPVLVRFLSTEDLGFMAPSKVLDFAAHVREKSTGGRRAGGSFRRPPPPKPRSGWGRTLERTAMIAKSGGGKKPNPG